MTTTEASATNGDGGTPRRANTGWLWGLFGMQALCAVFFALDAAIDMLGLGHLPGIAENDAFEYLIAGALTLSVYGTWRHIRTVTSRNARLTDQVRVASGEFSALLEEHFATWGLTPAERDVAMLTIKGLSVAEIAAARGSAEGTIKAHSAAVYRKAGVSGRMQLVTLFLDELMNEALGGQRPPGRIDPDTTAVAD